jgi:hypothetical protein
MNAAISTQSCARNLVLSALIAMIAVGSATSFGDTPSPAVGETNASTAGDTTSPATSAEIQEITVTASTREETASRIDVHAQRLFNAGLLSPRLGVL